MAHQLVSNVSFPLYFLEPGKPDPNVYWEKGEKRPRVKQSPQKGGTCWYYTMQRLREHIGKQFPPEYKQAREIEKTCSLLRKNWTRIENDTKFAKMIVDKLIETFLKNPSLSEFKNNLPVIEGFIEYCLSEGKGKDKDELTTTLGHVRAFCQQEKINDFSDYLNGVSITAYMHAHNQFYKSMKIDPKVMYENHIKVTLIEDCPSRDLLYANNFDAYIESLYEKAPSFESLSDSSKLNKFNIYSQGVALQAFGFKPSKWLPPQTINVLTEDLKAHGPLLVMGEIGRPGYVNQPRVVSEVAGRSIYGWNKNEPRKTGNYLGCEAVHGVVVVGAENQGSRGGFIYYIDPTDGSDPNNVSEQRIYVISYKSFQERVTQCCNIPTVSQSGSQLRDTSPVAYALYHEPENQLALAPFDT